jgi:polysaccharide deacetylase 2 family uncharacterized protein YibQ
MRKTTVASLTVIALALAAIVGGFQSGVSNAPVSPIVKLRPMATPSVKPVRSGSSDAEINDSFSDDDVVIDRPILEQEHWIPASLSVVVGLSGTNAALDGAFLRLGMPVALDLDPHASDAQLTAQYVADAHQTLFIHVTAPPNDDTLARLRDRFGAFVGVASHGSEGMPQALAGTGLAFFDERGDADRAEFARNNVRLWQRDTTVDDRTGNAYIVFMLNRAALRSRKAGRLVALMRPLPDTLAALQAFAGTRSAQIVSLNEGGP